MSTLTVQAEIVPDIIATPLSENERGEFNQRCQTIVENVHRKNLATSNIIAEVDMCLKKQLWRDDYASDKEFVKAILNIELSSAHRHIKAHKMYLYLCDQAEDGDELGTLQMMSESVFRELRRIATDGKAILSRNGESEEEYHSRQQEKFTEDMEAITDLWKWIYPKIKFYRLETNKGLLPGGGFVVTAGDITESAKVLQHLLHEEPKVEVEGKHISMEEIERASGNAAPEVLDSLATLAVREQLIDKFHRQKDHIREKTGISYYWDKFEGTFNYENGKLIITTPLTKVDFLNEISDLIGKEGAISIRRIERDF